MTVAPAGEGRGVHFAALGVPQFRWYWLASGLSTTGDAMENVLRNWLIWQLTGSPLWLGLMVFAHWVPYAVLSLWSGVLADRYDNRKLQILAQSLLGVAALGVAIATLAGFVTPWWIFGLLLLHGVAGSIGAPAQQTLVHALVGRERLLSAVSLSSSMRQLAQVIGPVLGGALLVSVGPGWGFLLNALTFLPLLAVLRILTITTHGGGNTGQTLSEGLRFVQRRPALMAFILAEMLPVVFLGQAFQSLLPAFVTLSLHSNEFGYALLLAGSGLGALVAAIAVAYSSTTSPRPRLAIVAAIAQTAAVLLFALSTSYLLSLALLVVVGAATVLTQSYVNTTLQLSAPDALRGRVMGVYSFGTQGLRVLNGPLLGGLALLVSTPLAVAGSAGVVLVALGAMLARLHSLAAPDLST